VGNDAVYGAPGNPEPRKGVGRGERVARWLIWPLLLALVALVVVFYVLFTPLQVVGPSMLPTLEQGDRVLRTKEYGAAQRGDVVIIDAARVGTDSDDIVKRVIAVPGDTVEIRDDVALVNGEVEDYTRRVRIEGQGEYRDPVTIEPNEVYVLGDNRPVSLDSRFTGPLPLDHIRGRAVLVFLPLHRAQTVR